MTDTEMITNEAIAHFKPKVESPPQSFLYCYLKQYDFSRLASTSSIATATNSKAIRDLPILLPNRNTVAQFDAIASPLFQKIRNQQQKATILAALRDTLLPRLISGQLMVEPTTGTFA
jgi:type I restriction enzyme S subunit